MHNATQTHYNGNIYLKERFLGLIKKFCDDRNLGEGKFQILVNHYESEKRLHHNFQHLQEMFEFLDRYRSKIQNLDTVEFAVWFHDVIYNTSNQEHGKNEKDSSKLAGDIMRELTVPEDIIIGTKQLIDATIDHKIPPGIMNESDTGLFLDADMSVLGASPERYAKYTQAIKAEYRLGAGKQVPDEVFEELYTKGRLNFLENTLKTGAFITPEVKAILGAQSNENMRGEISQLQTQSFNP